VGYYKSRRTLAEQALAGRHFSQLVQRLSDQANLRFAIWEGSRCLLRKGHRSNNRLRCVDLTGRTSLLEMVEWIRRAALMVTNDTGPMHVAAALGVRVLALFGPTDPRRTGPYGQIEDTLRIQLPCSPCLKPVCYYEKPIECLRRISPEHACNIAIRRLELTVKGAAENHGVRIAMSRAKSGNRRFIKCRLLGPERIYTCLMRILLAFLVCGLLGLTNGVAQPVSVEAFWIGNSM
jgi:hypothetical protein